MRSSWSLLALAHLACGADEYCADESTLLQGKFAHREVAIARRTASKVDQPGAPRGYEHIPEACVRGSNIRLVRDSTPAQCALLCDAEDTCLAYEFGVGRGPRRRSRTGDRANDCRLKSSADRRGCAGAIRRKDLYVKSEATPPFWAWKGTGQCSTADESSWRQRRDTSLAVNSLSDCKEMCQQQSSCTGIDWKNPESAQSFIDYFEAGRRPSVPEEIMTSGNCNLHSEDNPMTISIGYAGREIDTEFTQGWECWHALAEEPTTAVIFDNLDDLLAASPGTLSGSADWVDQNNVPGPGASVSNYFSGQVANAYGRRFWSEADDSICGFSFKAGTAASHVMVGIATGARGRGRTVIRWQQIYFGTTIRGASSPTLDIYQGFREPRSPSESLRDGPSSLVYTMDGRVNNGDFLNDVYAMRINHDGYVEYSLNGDVYYTSSETVTYPWHVAADAFTSPSLVDLTYLRC